MRFTVKFTSDSVVARARQRHRRHRDCFDLLCDSLLHWLQPRLRTSLTVEARTAGRWTAWHQLIALGLDHLRNHIWRFLLQGSPKSSQIPFVAATTSARSSVCLAHFSPTENVVTLCRGFDIQYRAFDSTYPEHRSPWPSGYIIWQSASL